MVLIQQRTSFIMLKKIKHVKLEVAYLAELFTKSIRTVFINCRENVKIQFVPQKICNTDFAQIAYIIEQASKISKLVFHIKSVEKFLKNLRFRIERYINICFHRVLQFRDDNFYKVLNSIKSTQCNNS